MYAYVYIHKRPRRPGPSAAVVRTPPPSAPAAAASAGRQSEKTDVDEDETLEKEVRRSIGVGGRCTSNRETSQDEPTVPDTSGVSKWVAAPEHHTFLRPND